jgi:hypothetical protein
MQNSEYELRRISLLRNPVNKGGLPLAPKYPMLASEVANTAAWVYATRYKGKGSGSETCS